jgi:hypothetical protein
VKSTGAKTVVPLIDMPIWSSPTRPRKAFYYHATPRPNMNSNTYYRVYLSSVSCEGDNGNVLILSNRATKYTGNQYVNCRKRWILETPASFLNTLSSFNVFAPLPTLSPNVLQNHFRPISGCCFHSMLQYVSPDAFELATSCSVNEASTPQSPFFWIKTRMG